MREGGSRWQGLFERVLALLSKLSGRGVRRSERSERMLLVLAVIVFVVAGIVAWDQLPDLERDIEPSWFLVVAALGLTALAVNGREFAFSARLLGSPVGGWEALRVSTLSSAANVLPIPGSVVIRTRALLQGGASLRAAGTATTAVGLAWVSAAALAAALVGALASRTDLLVIFAASGFAGAALAGGLLWYAAPALHARDLIQLVVIEAMSVGVSGLRLYAVAQAFDFRVGLGQAVTVNLGGILSNVAGILPGGLGLREIASGAFGALVGVPASVGVLMATLDRLGFYLVLASVAALLLSGRRRTRP